MDIDRPIVLIDTRPDTPLELNAARVTGESWISGSCSRMWLENQLVPVPRRVLERANLTRNHHREIAETLSARAVTFDLEASLTLIRDGDE